MTTMVSHFRSNGQGVALNDGARVIVASAPTHRASAITTSLDPFTCTCHLFSNKLPQQLPQQLHWSSSESTLHGGSAAAAAAVVRQQRLMQRLGRARENQQQQQILQQQLLHLDQLSSMSDSQLECSGACCCEWLGKALLCSCQLPSSSDEAQSPLRQQLHHHHPLGHMTAGAAGPAAANGVHQHLV